MAAEPSTSAGAGAPPATGAPLSEAAVASLLRDGLENVRRELYGSVVPFWCTYSPDDKNGGYFNCLDHDGAVFDRKKYVWLQGRQVWMLAKLYNTHTPETWESSCAAHKDPTGTIKAPTHEGLKDLAAAGAAFLIRHCTREDGQVYFCLAETGEPAMLQRKIFAACFYVMGLSECALATGNASYKTEAFAVLDRILEWIATPGALGRPSLPGAPDLLPLNVPMILLNLFQELEQHVPPSERPLFHADQRKWCVEEIKKHVKPEMKLVLENVGPDGSYDSTCPEGRVHTPGHAIECGWFLLEYALSVGDKETEELALNIIDWSYDAGLDKEHGGLYYFLDAEGFSPVQLEWNMKLWWPHCESLVAFAYAFKATKRDAYASRFTEVLRYTLDHFAEQAPGKGGWYGYLDREGRKTHRFKGGPYKGFFHVPRALLVVERLLAETLTELETAV